MNSFIVFTLGCKVNLYESEAISDLLIKQGYKLVKQDQKADICIVNTCSVTNQSESKSRQLIRKIIKNNKPKIMVVMGCYSQIDPKVVSSIEGVNIVIGTSFRNQIVNLIEEYKKNKIQIIKLIPTKEKEKYEDLELDTFRERTRAFVKIGDGCDNYCSYCVIPYTRGSVKSRCNVSILEEIKRLVSQGFKEIVLTAINIGKYYIKEKDYDLSDLLIDIENQNPELNRLAISSIEINSFNDKLIKTIKNSKIINPHLHIPLQSGSDKVLKKMNRKYNVEQYNNIIKKIRKNIPNTSITTDVIVGFPFENNEDFNDSIKTIKRNKFTSLHVFPYSPKKETASFKFKEVVSDSEKNRRVEELMKLSDILLHKKMKKTINNIEEVLFEKFDNQLNINYGHSSTHLQVIVFSETNLEKEIKRIKIKKIQNINDKVYLLGELYKKQINA